MSTAFRVAVCAASELTRARSYVTPRCIFRKSSTSCVNTVSARAYLEACREAACVMLLPAIGNHYAATSTETATMKERTPLDSLRPMLPSVVNRAVSLPRCRTARCRVLGAKRTYEDAFRGVLSLFVVLSAQSVAATLTGPRTEPLQLDPTACTSTPACTASHAVPSGGQRLRVRRALDVPLLTWHRHTQGGLERRMEGEGGLGWRSTHQAGVTTNLPLTWAQCTCSRGT